jgi:hypothetical protein
LRAAGDPSISADTLQLVVTDMPSGGPVLTVLWQGTTVLSNGPPTGVQFGAGVRCVGGVLKRLEKANAFGGAISYPTQTFPDIHSASAAKGFPILPPVTLHYFAAYRNSAAGTPCGDAALGYNATNAGSIAWMP